MLLFVGRKAKRVMMKNVIKKILIGLLIIIILIVIAAVLGYQFYVKPKIVEPIKEIAQSDGLDAELFSKDKILEEIEATLNDEDVRKYLDQNAPGQTDELIGVVNDAKNNSSEKKSEKKEDETAIAVTPSTTPGISENDNKNTDKKVETFKCRKTKKYS